MELLDSRGDLLTRSRNMIPVTPAVPLVVDKRMELPPAVAQVRLMLLDHRLEDLGELARAPVRR